MFDIIPSAMVVRIYPHTLENAALFVNLNIDLWPSNKSVSVCVGFSLLFFACIV